MEVVGSSVRMGACSRAVVFLFLVACSNESAQQSERDPRPAPAAPVKSEAELKAEAEFRKREEEARALAAENAKVNELDEAAASVEKVAGKRTACKSLWFVCEADDDDEGKAAQACERDVAKWSVDGEDRDEHARVGQKTAYWSQHKCAAFTAQFDKADKAKAATRRARYTNRCGGDYPAEGVRLVEDDVEYEMIAYSRSGTSVRARIRLTNKGSSPADGLSLGYSQAVTTDGKEFDLAGGEGSACTPDALNPGSSITCGVAFSIPKDLEVEGIKVSTLSKWHFAGNVCAKGFIP